MHSEQQVLIPLGWLHTYPVQSAAAKARAEQIEWIGSDEIARHVLGSDRRHGCLQQECLTTADDCLDLTCWLEELRCETAVLLSACSKVWLKECSYMYAVVRHSSSSTNPLGRRRTEYRVGDQVC